MSQPLPQTDPRTRDIDVLLCALSEPLVEELQADSYLMRGVTSSEFVPRCNINVEPDGSVDIILEVPGFRRDQLEICVSNGVLTVSGRSESHANHALIRRERAGGSSFSRHFRVSLNTTESDLSAWHEDGLLTVRIALGNRLRAPKTTILQAQAQTHKVQGARSPPLSLSGLADHSSSSGDRARGSDPRSSSLTTSNERSSGSNCSESNDRSGSNDRSSPSGSGSSERPSPSASGSGSGSNDASDRSGSNDRSPPTGPGQPQDRSSSPTSSHTSLLSSEGSHHNRSRAHHHHHHHHKRGRHSFESSSSSSSSEKRRRHAVAAAVAAAAVGGGGAAAGGGGSVGDALSRLVEADGCATPSRFPW